MNERDLLLEIGCEEVPSRFMAETLSRLKDQAGNLFQENHLPYTTISTFGTPRRIVLYVQGLANRQKDLNEKIKGPPKEIAYTATGEPTKAAHGFAQGQEVRLEQVSIEEINGREYLIVIKKTRGIESTVLLPQILPELIKGISFPKTMYWKTKDIRFARPIRWIMSLFGADIINFTYAGLKANRYTRGHRFLAPGPFLVEDPSDYFKRMTKAFVVLDQNLRKKIIINQLKQAAAACHGEAYIKKELLEEVNFLVEYPTAVVGDIDPGFLEIPREVLITAMQVHQRYFPVVDENNCLKPHFIVISNGNPDFVENVQLGNEKVLRARLADARFFYEKDREVALQRKTHRLKDIVFQEGLGTLYDKVKRLIKLSDFISERLKLNEENRQQIKRAAYLCKTDLVTRVVREFPDLQGVMGREYALSQGENLAVAEAIFEHYLPRFAGDMLPQGIAGMTLSIADRMDNIVGAFIVGIQPTGSQDPYALRRQSLGAVYIILEHKLTLSLGEIIETAVNCFNEQAHSSPENLREKILEFFNYRLRYIFQEQGIRYDIIDAVLAINVDKPLSLYKRARCLQEHYKANVVENVIASYTRIANLTGKTSVVGKIDPSLFVETIEGELFEACQRREENILGFLNEGEFFKIFCELAVLKPLIDRFFDNVLVMDKDEDLRRNRLLLLQRIQKLYLQIADFSRVVAG